MDYKNSNKIGQANPDTAIEQRNGPCCDETNDPRRSHERQKSPNSDIEKQVHYDDLKSIATGPHIFGGHGQPIYYIIDAETLKSGKGII
jgi:hypothetical protein